MKMNDQDNILNQFDKLLQTLNSISVELQSDVITKIEIKLNEFKNRINCKLSEHNLDTNTERTPQLLPQLKTNTNTSKTDINLEENSNLVSNVRKSERISNRKTSPIGSEDTETEKQIIIEYKSTSNQQIAVDNRLSAEKDPIITVSNESDETLFINPKIDTKEDKSVNRRKWRRTKDINDLKCKYCGKIWRSLSHLEIHLRTHTGEKVFECQKCGHRFAQLAGLHVHMRRHNNDRRFGCDVCNKTFYTKIDLTRHKSSHKEFKTITHCCEKCGKGFSETRKLKNHIRYVHEKKESVVCEICGHITHGQHLLYAHKRVKHGEMTKYACPICQTVIGSRSAFVVHLRAHADVKPCACDICGKQFRSKSQVARHKLAHMEGRHECSVCAKKFKTPHHLRRHQMIHSGNKPFDCHLCQYKCNVKSNVVKHVKSVHGIVDFSFVKQSPTNFETIKTDAFQKGSIVTQQVLIDISATKGQTITVNELKRLDEKKKKEKDLILKQMTKSVRNRKQFVKQRVVKHRKDILDDAIASTINDFNSNTGADTQSNETHINFNAKVNTGSHMTPVIIPNPSRVSLARTEPTHQRSKSTSCLPVNSEQHFKDVITLHFTNQLP